MKHLFLLIGLSLLFITCDTNKTVTANATVTTIEVADPLTPAGNPESFYNKTEHYIPMRDGVRLYVAVYTPKDASVNNTYPIMMQRTCYSAQPYGKELRSFERSPELANEKYIFVFQDVRGRWMSEGSFDNMRPYIPNKKNDQQIDESSDTYDTIEWLINNVSNNNGKVGIWGISYPGFYSTCSLIDAHPALKAVSPQAPIGDFYFDDFHHNGAYTLSYWSVNNLFGIQKNGPSDTAWYQFPNFGTPDMYDFYLRHTPLSKLDAVSAPDNFFWEEIKEHPDYDEFWQKRNIVQHLKDVSPAVMTVGGWFDAEDLYGPLMTYGNIEKWNKNTYNTIVMGPWSHGDWSRRQGRQSVSNVFFGENINEDYQAQVEARFFKHWLKGPADGKTGLAEAHMFDCGKKEWQDFVNWPPAEAQRTKFYFTPGGELADKVVAGAGRKHSAYVSDPAHPVPFRTDIKPMFIPRKYMADDQRHVSRRPDVLTFSTDVLKEDMTLAGPVGANLFVSTTGTDADWVVKVIDVYPGDHPDYAETQDNMSMGGYQQLVRGEVFRGRYRQSFEQGIPFKPEEVTEVNWQLQDVFHTFKKGHRLMIQVQSSWFPYVDMNPQTFVPNIFEAKEEDFQAQTHRLWHSDTYPSSVEMGVLE
jgi:putative CocE/NonD family hydrolase